jgi:uncharacterized protein YabN with tetrapyrrole methylase and pyrophosphatase domain
MEQYAASTGKSLPDLSLEDMEKIWQKIKHDG